MEQNPWHTSPPPHLQQSIVKRIKKNAQRRTALVFGLYSALALGMLGAFIPAYFYMKNEIARTGFSEFLALAYSDSALVVSNWREMTLTLLESLPIMSITIMLGLTFTFLVSLRMMAQVSRGKMRVKTI